MEELHVEDLLIEAIRFQALEDEGVEDGMRMFSTLPSRYHT